MSGLKLDMRLEGLGQALAKFKNAGNKIPVRSMKKAMRAGSEPVKAATKDASPVETGALKKSMTIGARSYRRGAYLLGVVGPRFFKYKSGRSPAYYAHLVEQGHRIAIGGTLNRMRRKKFKLGTGRIGGFVSGRGFMRQAAKQVFPRALRAFESAMRTNILGDFQ